MAIKKWQLLKEIEIMPAYLFMRKVVQGSSERQTHFIGPLCYTKVQIT